MNITSQKAMQAARMTAETLSVRQAADAMQIKREYVSHARTILAHGTPEEIEEVDAGRAAIGTVSTKIRGRQRMTDPSYVYRPRNPQPQPPALVVARGRVGAPVGVKLPPGTTPEMLARRALALRGTMPSTGAVAKELHVAKQTCRQMMDIVAISDRSDLSAAERKVAATTLDRMNAQNESLKLVYAAIEPIANRLWGDHLRRNIGSRQKLESWRVDRFEKAIGITVQACLNVRKLEVPHLPPVRRNEVVDDLRESINELRWLISTIQEGHR